MSRSYHVFDLIIIGAGTAGISALKEARKYTDNVLLIHEGEFGTTCARVGCMPSKALIHAANLYDSHKRMADAGIMGSSHLYPDIPSILKIVREKRDFYVNSVNEDLKQYEHYIMKGTARFESPTSLRANGNLFHAKNIVVASGSSPIIPSKYKELMPHVITSDTLFEYRDLPKRIGVIGLGPVGLEVAAALAKLEIEVTAITRDRNVGVVNDAEIQNTIVSALAEDMKVWVNADPKVSLSKEGVMLHSRTQKAMVDALFIAAGRKPNLDKLGLKRIGVEMDDNCIPLFNRFTMKVKDHPIYLAGDVTDERAVLHESSDEGRRAAYYAMHDGKNGAPRYTKMQIIFTKPVIAVVGDTKYALRHTDTLVGEADFSTQGRAMLENENKGKLHLFADKDGYFRGAEIMAPAADHLAHFLSLALTQHLKIDDILKTPFYHPTLEEGLRTALKDVSRKINK